MAWIEVHQSLLSHRKTILLGDALALPELYAASHLIALWTWALDSAPSGLLPASARLIARAAQWTGDADALVAALVAAGWLDAHDAGGYRIHDWDDYAGRLVEQRQRRREQTRERTRRWRAAEGAGAAPPGDASRPVAGDAPVTRHVTQCDASTVPNPTVPNRTQPDHAPSPAGEGEGRAAARPAAGAAAHRPAPKGPTNSKVNRVAALIAAAGVPVSATKQDGMAVQQCAQPERVIADAYLAAFAGEWGGGGDGWLRENLNLRSVCNRIAGYLAWKSGPSPPAGRNGHVAASERFARMARGEG